MEKAPGLKTAHLLAILVLASFAVRLALVHAQPLTLDECLYSEMVDEQLAHPSLVPTYLDFPTSWKPPLFFWLYAIPVAALRHLTNDMELIYRLPNLALGALNVLLVFLVFRRYSGDEKKALWAAALFAFCPLVIATDLRVLLDIMNAAFILASLYFYFEKPASKNLLIAALFAFLAAFTKSVVAFVIPIIALVRLLSRKELDAKALLSLLAVPAAVALHYLILLQFAPSLANEEFAFDVLGKVGGGMGYAGRAWLFFIVTSVLINILVPLSIMGILKFWKEEQALSAWTGAIVLAAIGSSGMWWYFYPFIPVLAYFSVRWLASENGKENMDAMFKLAIALAIALELCITALYYTQPAIGSAFSAEREAGDFLAGKEGVLFMGDYHSSVTAVAYKALEERQMRGSYLDFGWVIFPGGESPQAQGQMAQEFATNYNTSKFGAEGGNFARLFWNLTLFRKPSAIREFGYVVFSPLPDENQNYAWAENFTISGYETLSRNETIIVFRKTGN